MRCGAIAVLLVAAVLVMPVGGCSADAGQDESVGGASGVPAPGAEQLRGGRVRAVGTLVYENLEGGFWALKAAEPGSVSADSATVMVLVNGDDVGASSLEGQYVVAEGTPLEGASIRMAGPEMNVDSLEAIDTGSSSP